MTKKTHCMECGRELEVGMEPIYWYGDSPYCSPQCRGDKDD